MVEKSKSYLFMVTCIKRVPGLTPREQEQLIQEIATEVQEEANTLPAISEAIGYQPLDANDLFLLHAECALMC